MKTFHGFFCFAILCFSLAWAGPLHPRLFITDDERGALLDKIATVDWARKGYDGMRAQVEAYVNKHLSDPEWILSRIQMHWMPGKYTTNHYYNWAAGGVLTNATGNAPLPTVRFPSWLRPGTNRQGLTYTFPPPLEVTPPYSLDGKVLLSCNGGPYELADPGAITWRINGLIMDHALTSAFLYYVTRQEKYARFAADIFMVVTAGIAPMRRVYNNDGSAGLVTAQTIDDYHYSAKIPLIYDFIYDYLVSQQGVRTITLTPPVGKPLAYPVGTNASIGKSIVAFNENFLLCGYEFGNWNAVESLSLVLGALVLDDASNRSRYMDFFMNTPSTRWKPLWWMVTNIFNKEMLWEEPPLYNNYPIDFLVPPCVAAARNGYPVYERFPNLIWAGVGFFDTLFPNNNYPSYGDGHARYGFSAGTIEIGLRNAMRLGNRPAVAKLNASLRGLMADGYSRVPKGDVFGIMQLIDALPVLPPAPGEDVRPTTAQIDFAGLYAQRNLSDKRYGLMATLFAGGAQSNGALGYNHGHGKGLNMELYGRGQILGLDSGAYERYEDPLHSNYYTRFPGGNNVIVNGNSQSLERTRGMAFNHVVNLINIRAMEPTLDRSPVSPMNSFIDAAFQDGTNGLGNTSGAVTNTPHVAQQRRLLSIIRTSPTTGYYLDIFRSKWMWGDRAMAGNPDTNEKFHDYLYHNLGWRGVDSTTVRAPGSWEALPLSDGFPSIAGCVTAGWRDPTYGNFTRGQTPGRSSNNLVIDFDYQPVTMRAHVLGNENRQVHIMNAPLPGLSPGALKSAQTYRGVVPAMLVRQEGEAWDRPFITVFEPYDYGQPTVKSVRRFIDVPWSNDFVGLVVESLPLNPDLVGRREWIFSSTNTNRAWSFPGEGFNFQGVYGVWCENQQGFQYAYLGHGNKVARIGSHKIQLSGGASGSGLLVREEGRFLYSASLPATVVLRVENPSGGPFTNLTLYTVRSGLLVAATATTAVADASGNGGLVGGNLPAATRAPLLVGPRGMEGLGTATTIALTLNGRTLSGNRVTLAPSDRLRARFTAGCGISAPRCRVMGAAGAPVAHPFQAAGVDGNTVDLVLDHPESWSAATYTLEGRNDLGLPATTTLTVERAEDKPRISVSPNPFRPDVGPAQVTANLFGGEQRLRFQTVSLSGEILDEQSLDPRTDPTASLRWSGRDRLGRPRPMGIYRLRLVGEREGKPFMEETKVVVK